MRSRIRKKKVRPYFQNVIFMYMCVFTCLNEVLIEDKNSMSFLKVEQMNQLMNCIQKCFLYT